ncbi:MAG: efflux RND transporter permease subunit, partial [bacterium]|nr:efflux RND transporter permease subunit [bacterium]
MNLTRAALEKNRVTLVALVVIAIAGVQAFFSLPQAEDPGFTMRVATVITYFPGASPERIEQLVTDKVEKAVQEMPELDSVTSQSKTGISIVFVTIKQEYKLMRPIWDDLRRKIEAVTPQLPEGVAGPFVNDDFGDVFGTVLAVTGDGFTYAEMKEIADEVRDELLLIPEVAKVDIYGAQEERIFVEYSNARLAELGLSPLQLRAILDSSNIIIPGGDVRTADEEIVLEPTGNFESVDELRRTVVTLPGRGELIYLEDVARVYRDYVDPRRSEARYTGEPALVLAMSLREGGNIITLGGAVRETIERLRRQYPHGIELDFVHFQADVVAGKVHDFVRALLQAVGIVMLVMLGFLGLRTGLVVAGLIPMAILMSFLLMATFGIGIDQMSLAALMIALGMLIDNAIIMSESIMVQVGEGKPVREAAIDSANELRVPLLVSSLTTSAAFLPIFLAKSDTGEYTAPLFKVVTITLLSSWLLSLTMTPLLCVMFLKVKKAPTDERFESRFYRRYRGFLLLLLRHRLLSVGAVVLVFIAAMMLAAFVPAVFFPPHDRPLMVVELRLPLGTPLERTREVVDEVERFLAENYLVSEEEAAAGAAGVTSWAAFVGEGAPQFVLTYAQEQPAPEYAVLVVNAVSRKFVDRAVVELRAFCDAGFPGLKAQIGPLKYGPPVNNPIEVRISGRDPDTVFELVDAVAAKLREIPGPIAIADDWGARSKKLLVQIDQDRARRAGVTNQDVA